MYYSASSGRRLPKVEIVCRRRLLSPHVVGKRSHTSPTLNFFSKQLPNLQLCWRRYNTDCLICWFIIKPLCSQIYLGELPVFINWHIFRAVCTVPPPLYIAGGWEVVSKKLSAVRMWEHVWWKGDDRKCRVNFPFSFPLWNDHSENEKEGVPPQFSGKMVKKQFPLFPPSSIHHACFTRVREDGGRNRTAFARWHCGLILIKFSDGDCWVGLGTLHGLGDIYEVKDYTLNYSKDGPSPDYFVN